jgi:DNA topoisomerase IB
MPSEHSAWAGRSERAKGGDGANAYPPPSATPGSLTYVSDAVRGFRRQRRGKDFLYLSPDGRAVRSATVLRRIRELAIPPAYRDVWICMDPKGHLQATGRDARGRKQYRYHAQWRVARDGVKFTRMAAFGAALARLRRRVRRDLALPGMSREKVVATVVRLLDATLARVGNDEYARSNGSFGLTTLRNRHVQRGMMGSLRLVFRGKGGSRQEISIDDARVAAIVQHCRQLPGERLFKFVDDTGSPRPVDSEQVNEYLRKVMGADFTAKDFRTWGATTRCVEMLGRTPLPARVSERALKSRETEVVRKVAGELRNTPAVCRKSYINPIVFGCWRSGLLHRLADPPPSAAKRKCERVTLALLQTCAVRPQDLCVPAGGA